MQKKEKIFIVISSFFERTEPESMKFPLQKSTF